MLNLHYTHKNDYTYTSMYYEVLLGNKYPLKSKENNAIDTNNMHACIFCHLCI
jgi:hypothetical protein